MLVPDAFRSLRVTAGRGRSSLDGFFERWHDALVSCLPGRLQRLLARRDPCLIVVPEGAKARVFESQGGDAVSVGELDPQAPGSLQALLDGLKGKRRRTVVRLPERLVLKREVSFPTQVRDNLARVVEYEMDRLSPFQSDQVYFDFRTLEDPTRGGKVKIELALCLRERVGDWLQRLRDRGAPVEQVTWEGAWPKANLLPAQERPQRGTGLFSVNALLLLVVLLLGAAVLATPIWQMQRTRDERTAQIEEIKVRAEQVQEVRTALERARLGSVAVLQRKWEQPRMIDLLLELTNRLPDDTWLQNLDYNDGEIQLRGESAQATALIQLLDQAPGITEVTFRSPVVRAAGSSRERFHISLKYRRPEES
ncbi:MAG: PilN domain-containing protein [Chromatiaceae bacterium]|nr:PilN domain-containing protein [Chromatiaceae bacterium]